jgi:hypothetical protein
VGDHAAAAGEFLVVLALNRPALETTIARERERGMARKGQIDS